MMLEYYLVLYNFFLYSASKKNIVELSANSFFKFSYHAKKLYKSVPIYKVYILDF